MNLDINKRPERSVRDERLRQRLSTIEAPTQPKSTRKKKNIITWLLGVVIIVIIIAAVIILFRAFGQNKNKSEWQAVFLTNNEVYFGKVIAEDKINIILANIYYLQEPIILQHGSDINKQTGDFNLIKLGNEIHGPYDEMRINREHVLYIEDLRDDSKVVRAINQHQEK